MDWSHLKKSIKKEVSLTRELLSNLIAEENSLIKKDKATWIHIMHKRFDLTESLKPFRKERILSINLNDESSCELSLLLDQLIPLIDKINEQNVRNQNLQEHLVAIPDPLDYSIPMEPKGNLRKNGLTTLSRGGKK